MLTLEVDSYRLGTIQLSKLDFKILEWVQNSMHQAFLQMKMEYIILLFNKHNQLILIVMMIKNHLHSGFWTSYFNLTSQISMKNLISMDTEALILEIKFQIMGMETDSKSELPLKLLTTPLVKDLSPSTEVWILKEMETHLWLASKILA